MCRETPGTGPSGAGDAWQHHWLLVAGMDTGNLLLPRPVRFQYRTLSLLGRTGNNRKELLAGFGDVCVVLVWFQTHTRAYSCAQDLLMAMVRPDGVLGITLRSVPCVTSKASLLFYSPYDQGFLPILNLFFAHSHGVDAQKTGDRACGTGMCRGC